MADAHANFATSLVATAPSPAISGTSLVVATGEGTRYPTPPFNAVICPASAAPTPANAEIVRVTGISTDTLTITRTQESTSARTVLVGDRIYAGPTVKTFTDIEAGLFSVGGTGQPSALASGPVPTATGVVNKWYAAQLFVRDTTTLTGIRFRTGTTANGSVRSALFDSTLTKVADRTSNLAQAAVNTINSVAFSSTYAASPGLYYGLVWFSSATATFIGGRCMTEVATGTNATTTPTSIGSPAIANTDYPIMIAY